MKTQSFSKKRRLRRTGRNRQGRGLQTLGSVYNYQVSTGPVRAPPLPKEFSVSLSDFTISQNSSATDVNTIIFGLPEFLNKRPLFTTEFYTMYKYCRVTAVELRAEITNVGSSNIQFAVGHVPYEDVSTITLSKLSQLPGATRKSVSAQGGLDRVVVNKFFNVQQIIGNPAFDKTYWIDSTQSVSATPVDVREPTAVILIDNIAGGTLAFSFDLVTKVTYHLQWFGIETPGES